MSPLAQGQSAVSNDRKLGFVVQASKLNQADGSEQMKLLKATRNPTKLQARSMEKQSSIGGNNRQSSATKQAQLNNQTQPIMYGQTVSSTRNQSNSGSGAKSNKVSLNLNSNT